MRLLFPVLLALGAGAALDDASAADLAAHHAVYELKFDHATGADIAAAHGSMDFEMIDACDGWAVHQILKITMTNRDGQDVETSSDYVTWEAKDGRSFRFHMKQTTDTAVTSQVDGEASLTPEGGGEVRYTSPSEDTKTLPAGTLFPTAHTNAIITGAMQAQRFLAIPLLDGTSDEGVQDSFISVLNWGPAAPTADAKWPDLAKLASGVVHVAFFDRKPDTISPDYEVGMRYFENGVADDLRMDFGQFVMNGVLTEFKLLPKHC